jgi:hypothetical protein
MDRLAEQVAAWWALVTGVWLLASVSNWSITHAMIAIGVRLLVGAWRRLP